MIALSVFRDGNKTIKADGQGYRAGEIVATVVGAELRATIPQGTWMHLAVVRRAGNCALFIGGVQRTSVTCGTGPIDIDQLSLGFVARARGDYEVSGSVALLRLSSTARYAGTFSPPVRYTPDASTALLWRLDEGSGAVATDASLHFGDGQITSGTWSTSGPCNTCGDAVIQHGEACDDGDLTTRDCPYGAESCIVCSEACSFVAGATAYCGDGRINAAFGENCDDGNAGTEACPYGQVSCTVCSSSCHLEPGAATYCGDGVVDASDGETCDDGNAVTETCAYGQTSCTVCGSRCRRIAGPTHYCGDGTVNSGDGETCDDGNAVTEACAYGQQSCSVCAANCRSAPGATAYCGDGVVDSSDGEACDDGNSVPGDGCSPTCGDETCRHQVSFDGTTGWASLPAVPTTTPFTIEGWVNGRPTSSSTRVFGTLCGGLSWQSSGFWAEVFPDCNGTSRRYSNDAGTPQIIPYTSFPSGWFHLAMVVPAPNQVRIFVNGQLVGSSNSLTYDSGVGGRYCGSIAALHDCGHGVVDRYSSISVSDFRVSNGARYSGGFTPAAALSPDGTTVIRYDFQEGQGTVLTDGSGGGRDGRLTGGATWACPSEGTHAIKTTSLNSSLTCNSSGFGLGHGNFTFEFWIKTHNDFVSSPTWGTPPAGHLFTQNEAYAVNAIRPDMASGGQMHSYTYNTSSGSANVDHITGFVDDGLWHHYALVREGSTARTYIDGALSATQSGIDPNLVAMSNMAIGVPQAYSSYTVPPVFLGPIRYSSTARYASAFVPAKAWPIDGNTIAQYLTTTPFDGTTLQDEAGRNNDCSFRAGWISSQGP